MQRRGVGFGCYTLELLLSLLLLSTRIATIHVFVGCVELQSCLVCSPFLWLRGVNDINMLDTIAVPSSPSTAQAVIKPDSPKIPGGSSD